MSELAGSNEEQILVDQIHEETRKIRQHKALLDNNHDLGDLCDPIDKAIIENNSFLAILEDKKLTGCSVTKLNPVEDLFKNLKNEVEFICKDMAKLVKKIKDLEDLNMRLDQNTENLELMLEASKSSLVTSRRLDIIEKNVKQRFIKEKKELKTVITTLFPDNLDVQDLIAQITEYYFTEGADKYMQMEESDNIEEQIELLLKTEIFELNPHNPKQIRLADLI